MFAQSNQDNAETVSLIIILNTNLVSSLQFSLDSPAGTKIFCCGTSTGRAAERVSCVKTRVELSVPDDFDERGSEQIDSNSRSNRLGSSSVSG